MGGILWPMELAITDIFSMAYPCCCWYPISFPASATILVHQLDAMRFYEAQWRSSFLGQAIGDDHAGVYLTGSETMFGP